jgi:hypothetical protein
MVLVTHFQPDYAFTLSAWPISRVMVIAWVYYDFARPCNFPQVGEVEWFPATGWYSCSRFNAIFVFCFEMVQSSVNFGTCPLRKGAVIILELCQICGHWRFMEVMKHWRTFASATPAISANHYRQSTAFFLLHQV